MKRIAALFLAACLLLALAGCRAEAPAAHLSLEPPAGTGGAGEPEPLVFEIVPGDTRAGLLRSGKLILTVEGARAASRAADVPEGGFKQTDDFVILSNGSEETEYKFQNCVQADGSFREGVRLILVDFTLESQDAENETAEEAGEHGRYQGKYQNPYIFRADSLFYLMNASEAAQKASGSGSLTAVSRPSFFSLYGQLEEHDFAFELLPGETIRFTLGYPVGNFLGGAPAALSDLCLSDAPSWAGATLIDLNLGGD